MADQIEVKNVSFEYTVDSGRVLAIKDINFSVAQSEFLCLLGPSGCGKTTILNILAGLLQPTSGEIRIGDAPINSNRQNRGVVFQDFAQLFPWRTARQNVEFGLEMRRVGQGDARARPRSNSCAWSVSRNSPTCFRTSCPAACSNASRSPARLPTIRRCC